MTSRSKVAALRVVETACGKLLDPMSVGIFTGILEGFALKCSEVRIEALPDGRFRVVARSRKRTKQLGDEHLSGIRFVAVEGADVLECIARLIERAAQIDAPSPCN